MYHVYRIINKINNKSYIGITSRSVDERWEEHLSRVRNYNRQNRIYVAMKKYCVESFTHELVASTPNEDVVREMETFFIHYYDSYRNGYNCNFGGCGNLNISPETRKKISERQKGKIISLESRRNMSLAKIGDKRCANNFGEYTNKGNNHPMAKSFLIQFPDGHKEVIMGISAFCRKHKLYPCHMYMRGKCKGFILFLRLNDHPEREYTQASGNGAHPEMGEDMVYSA